jgi:CheY-like chemotaxis protein
MIILLGGIVLVWITGSHVKELPPLIWSLLGCYALWLLREPVVAMTGRIRTFKGFGIEFSLVEEAFGEALRKRGVNLAGLDREATLARLKENQDRLAGAEILWLDDNPSDNRNEARVLQFSGAAITSAVSVKEAVKAIEVGAGTTPFDFILSDVTRENDPETGTAILDWLPKLESVHDVIFYVGHAEPGVPVGALGITDRPDELLRLVVNALARRNGR